MMEFIDTATEDVERIKKARENISKGATLMLIPFGIMAFTGLGLYFVGYIVTGLYFMASSLCYTVLIVGLIIKREIFSLAILIKEEQE